MAARIAVSDIFCHSSIRVRSKASIIWAVFFRKNGKNLKVFSLLKTGRKWNPFVSPLRISPFMCGVRRAAARMKLEWLRLNESPWVVLPGAGEVESFIHWCTAAVKFSIMSNFQISNLLTETCLSCPVLSQDSKSGIYFDVWQLETPKIAFQKVASSPLPGFIPFHSQK